jgi:peptide chain release factor 2
LASKERRVAEIEELMSNPGFWDHQARAQKTTSELALLRNSLTMVNQFKAKLSDLETLVELVGESDEDEAELYLAEIEESVQALTTGLDQMELQSFLKGPHDKCNAILTVHAGAGGTESCDWADMLFRMYTRWAERAGFEVDIQDLQDGDEAGLSRATIRLVGPNAFGFSKAERGVHRLVRISPFDSNKRRHTSFCSVDVIAEIEDDVDVEIKEEDLRIDTFRSSGKGGQHVNKTDSAIRITHYPSGLVVSCQNDRSQHKNRETAMKTLKSRLFERMQDEKRSEMEKFYGEKGDIGWGNQIRSYVFQPYQMVKDLRTGVETSNVQGVMDGQIDPFIHAWLRAGGPRTRSNLVVDQD